MSKKLLKKEMIFIDFEKNEFNFYHVEVLSVGYNELQVITNYGKLGNKGKENIVRLSDYKEAMKLAYKKIYDKKSSGYISKEKMKDAITAAASFYQKEETNRKSKSKKVNYSCQLCGKDIDEKLYKKINDWARGGGNWDSDENFVGYKKVLCVSCQIDHEIYQKRIESK